MEPDNVMVMECSSASSKSVVSKWENKAILFKKKLIGDLLEDVRIGCPVQSYEYYHYLVAVKGICFYDFIENFRFVLKNFLENLFSIKT